MRALTTFLVTSVAAWAQVSGPMLGYVPDGVKIRPMYGFPAAGAVGAAIDAGRDFALTAISPRQDYALATAADTGEALVVKPGKSVTSVTGAAAGADRIVMSPRGSAAVLWFSSNHHIQAVAGLPDAPSVRDVDLSFLAVAPGPLAISDDGQWVAGAWPAGVYAFGPNGEVNLLPADTGVTALAFFHKRQDLALATAARVTSIADVGGSAQPSVVYDYSSLQFPEAEKLRHRRAPTVKQLAPIGLALSFDNRAIVLADSRGIILGIDTTAGTAQSIDCSCAPDGVYGLGGAVFRLTTTGEVKLFDAAAAAVLIVPPAPPVTGGQQ